MKPKNTLLMLAFLLSAISTEAAVIQISSLPFNIIAPGTYVFASNLNFTDITNTQDTGLMDAYPAITISTSLTGPVVLDLKGHALTGSGVLGTLGSGFWLTSGGTGIAVGYALPGGQRPFVFSGPNTNSITIRNGTFQNLSVGVAVTTLGGSLSGYFSNIHISNITCNNDFNGIVFGSTNSSTISDCVFINVGIGISDTLSKGGNYYTSNVFHGFSSGENKGGAYQSISIENSIPSVVETLRFQAPQP
jgi:hypothetical protein